MSQHCEQITPAQDFNIVIPARYASSRLPGKPLLPIAGKPMLAHVWQRALDTGLSAEQIVIATDDERIFDAAQGFGAQVLMTRTDHVSGTDRLFEVAERMQWPDNRILVNLQGDEPLMPPALIHQVAALLDQQADAGVASLCTPLSNIKDVLNPNIVKVAFDDRRQALYFSRAPIPWPRQLFIEQGLPWEQREGATPAPLAPGADYYRHLGMYAYRVSALRAFAKCGPTRLEQLESLEQLRFLEQGIAVMIEAVQETPPHGVDTPEDLARVNKLMANAE